jgi:hypothetical protein
MSLARWRVGSAPRSGILIAAVLIGLVVAGRDAVRPATAAARTRERIAFADVPWGTPADSALAFLTRHGYRPVAAEENRLVCQGTLFDHAAVVRGDVDERDRIVRWTVTVLAAAKEEPEATRKIYDDMVAEARGKYGSRDRQVEKFRFPYKRGDGREEEALRQGFAVVRSVWEARSGDVLTIERDRSLSVILTYETTAWRDLESRRRRRKASDL